MACFYLRKKWLQKTLFSRKVATQTALTFQSAVGFEHQSELSKHASQTDAAKGFGGKFGVQKDRVDKVRKYNQRRIAEL